MCGLLIKEKIRNTSCQTECAKINFSLLLSVHERDNTKSRLRKGGMEPTEKEKWILQFKLFWS